MFLSTITGGTPSSETNHLTGQHSLGQQLLELIPYYFAGPSYMSSWQDEEIAGAPFYGRPKLRENAQTKAREQPKVEGEDLKSDESLRLTN